MFSANVSNARNYMKGLAAEYTFEGVGRTAPEDYFEKRCTDTVEVHNLCKSTRWRAVKEHLDRSTLIL